MVSDELRLRLHQSESLSDILFLNKGSSSPARFNLLQKWCLLRLTKQLSGSGKQLLAVDHQTS